jgi:flavorubredoxin
MGVPIKSNLSWVGKVDWELRKFHGEEYSTHKGTSYNSYLVQEEKTVLIETVWAPFAKEYVRNLQKIIDLNAIDYIIANHGEIDHSGALPELIRQIPETPIYCTANAVKSLKGQYHQEWNFLPLDMICTSHGVVPPSPRSTRLTREILTTPSPILPMKRSTSAIVRRPTS